MKIVHDEIQFEESDLLDMEERAAEHWLEILEKMESSFKDSTPPEEVNEKQRQERLEGRILFAKYFHNLWS